MRSVYRVGRIARVIVLPWTLFWLASCTNERTPSTARASEGSVYQLGSTWRDQTGTARPLRSLQGKVQIVTMIYTQCSQSCPIILTDLKRIAAKLPRTPHSNVGFVLVTLSPRFDTPERLARYARQAMLDAHQWTLLTGSDDDVRELAAVLAVRYRQVSPVEVTHTNVITVLDDHGVIIDQIAGQPDDVVDRTVAAVKRAIP